mgnify:CR=1 FL=1|tara:strand:- start:235 stop:870 length:636 start_codon:yes stop_codon:yes gene_type:complete
MYLNPVTPKNYGWLQLQLNDEYITHIWDCINTAPIASHKKNLIGHVEKSILVKDKNNKLFNDVMLMLIEEYGKHWGHEHTDIPMVDQYCQYYMSDFWVNYQNQHEYNPIHNHRGIYSFAAWLKIPTDFKEQAQHYTSVDANNPTNSSFIFEYTNTLGQIKTYMYQLDPSWEGTLLFFPSALRHAVHPFYDCEEQRVSISGNIMLRPKNENE